MLCVIIFKLRLVVVVYVKILNKNTLYLDRSTNKNISIDCGRFSLNIIKIAHHLSVLENFTILND